jgi:hypothetical protein
MKKLICLISVLMLMNLSCQTNSELSDSKKEIIVNAVKETSQQFYEKMREPNDPVTFRNVFMGFWDENAEYGWQTEPVVFVDNFQIRRNKSDMDIWLKNLTESRISTNPMITESHYEVLSNDKVLEVTKGDFTFIRKDSTIVGPIEMINTTIWTNKNGKWMIQFFHQSTRRKQG